MAKTPANMRRKPITVMTAGGFLKSWARRPSY
jgi:hypothetical protein